MANHSLIILHNQSPKQITEIPNTLWKNFTMWVAKSSLPQGIAVINQRDIIMAYLQFKYSHMQTERRHVILLN